MPVSIEKKETEGNTSSNSLKNISPPPPPQGGANVEEAESARISPSNIFSPTESKKSHQEGQVG